MCGNIHLIALDELAEEGLIDQSDLPGKIPVQEVDYSQVNILLKHFSVPCDQLWDMLKICKLIRSEILHFASNLIRQKICLENMGHWFKNAQQKKWPKAQFLHCLEAFRLYPCFSFICK